MTRPCLKDCRPAEAGKVVSEVGVSPSGKAAGFDPAIRRFESFHPSQVRALARGRVGTRRRAHGAMSTSDTLALFAGNAIPALAQDIARSLQTPLGRAYVGRFSDGEVNVELMR